MPAERWSADDDAALRRHLELGDGRVSWQELARLAFPDGKFSKQECIARWSTLSRPKPLRGPWTKDEDTKLEGLVAKYGSEKWVVIANEMATRSGKQCRERWHNHLDPTLNKGEWTAEEEAIIHRLYGQIGSRWAEMAKHLPGRSDNSVKNFWNASLVRQKRRRGGSISSLAGALDLSGGEMSPDMSRSSSSTSLSSGGGSRFAPYQPPNPRSPGMTKSRSYSGSSYSSLSSLAGVSPLRRGSIEDHPPPFASPYYSPAGMSRSHSYSTTTSYASPAFSASHAYSPALPSSRSFPPSQPLPGISRDLNKEVFDPSAGAYPYPTHLRDTPPPTPPDRPPTYRRPHANSSPAAVLYPYDYTSPPSPASSSNFHQAFDGSHAWTNVIQGSHPPGQSDAYGNALGYETLQIAEEHEFPPPQEWQPPPSSYFDRVPSGLPSGLPSDAAYAAYGNPSSSAQGPSHSHGNSFDSQNSLPHIQSFERLGHPSSSSSGRTHAHTNSSDSQQSISHTSFDPPHQPLQHVASPGSVYADERHSPYANEPDPQQQRDEWGPPPRLDGRGEASASPPLASSSKAILHPTSNLMGVDKNGRASLPGL